VGRASGFCTRQASLTPFQDDGTSPAWVRGPFRGKFCACKRAGRIEVGKFHGFGAENSRLADPQALETGLCDSLPLRKSPLHLLEQNGYRAGVNLALPHPQHICRVFVWSIHCRVKSKVQAGPKCRASADHVVGSRSISHASEVGPTNLRCLSIWQILPSLRAKHSSRCGCSRTEH
jgi:hypothetical protein